MARKLAHGPSIAVLVSLVLMVGTGGVIAKGGGPPHGNEGNAGEAEYKPPCHRPNPKPRPRFQRSDEREIEGNRLAAQGLEGCKG